MVEIVIFAITYAVIVITDLVPVYREKKRKTVIFCTVFFAFALLLQILVSAGVELPSPVPLIESAVRGITGMGAY